MASELDLILNDWFSENVTKLHKLNGYENANYLLESDGKKYIFKTYEDSSITNEHVSAENAALYHLDQYNSTSYPEPIPFNDNTDYKRCKVQEKPKIIRVLSYIEGEFLAEAKPSENLFRSLGHFLGEMDTRLQDFQNPIYKARQCRWDIQFLELNKEYIEDINNPHNRNIVRYFFKQYEEIVRPRHPELRKQIIHNDANEWNVLTQNEKVTGIIDFGDMSYTFLINELAIAITYGCYDKDDPLHWAQFIIEGYNEKMPVLEIELSLLYYLIAARLCISVCNSAHAKTIDADNTYTSVSEKPAWSMLQKWLTINPIAAENSFRSAVGLPPKTSVALENVISKRHKHISTTYSLSYDKPIHMARSAFQYMYDVQGNTFLDAYNNIPHVGHAHPVVVDAGQRQMAKLNTNTRYLYDQLAEYAERLASKFPSSLNKVYLVNSGSAASDLAIRMAKAHTDHSRVMVMELGYHGNTHTSMEVSDYKFSNPKGQGQADYILKTQIPDTYKGPYTDPLTAGKLYAKEAVSKIESSHHPIAAFIAEPIIGCAGQVPLPTGYLQEIYPVIRQQGGVCISDEVQTGFGRLGDFFWGYEASKVVPDIVIMGKPIANGHPMGAVICTDEIAQSFEKGVEFFSSFGGNPVSCAIASAVLDVIEEEQLQENAQKVGHYYMSKLQELMQHYDTVGDVRGRGLFIGVELVQPHSKKPNPQLAKHIKSKMRQRNILISTDGRYDNILKSKPPLCFNKHNVDTVIEALHDILKNYNHSKN
jgi:4-aminobutyrate aminotransferase-like enzyme/aminoglycoside phosphotransferase (APT) family kinase protein